MGVQVWATGGQYEGEWYEDERTGLGRLTLPSGDMYIGEMRCNAANGLGTYYERKDGVSTTRIGTWIDNKQIGRGVQLWCDESRGLFQFAGDVRDDKKHGYGIL